MKKLLLVLFLIIGFGCAPNGVEHREKISTHVKCYSGGILIHEGDYIEIRMSSSGSSSMFELSKIAVNADCVAIDFTTECDTSCDAKVDR